MASSTHPFVVKSSLSAEEFISLEHMCDEEGLSQSAFIRMLIKHRARQSAEKRSELGQELDCE